MSTRACYRFIPENGPNDWPGVITVYKHSDGYPSGAAKAIDAALEYSWPLPRFEAEEFAAGFVAANKTSAERYAQEYDKRAEKAEAEGRDSSYCRDWANKYRTDKSYQAMCGGGVRLVPFEGLDAYQRFAADIEYLYDIRCVAGKIRVTAYATSERDGEWTVEKFFEGSTKQLARRK